MEKYVNVNVNLMVENVIQIKGGVTRKVNAKISASIMGDLEITCDKIIKI